MKKLFLFLSLMFVTLMAAQTEQGKFMLETSVISNNTVPNTGLGYTSEKDGVKRLKLSINTNQSQVDMAEAMAEKIEELSNGKMAIDIYGDGQLGGDREVAETVQYGNIDMCVVSTTPVAAFYQDLNLFEYLPIHFVESMVLLHLLNFLLQD